MRWRSALMAAGWPPAAAITRRGSGMPAVGSSCTLSSTTTGCGRWRSAPTAAYWPPVLEAIRPCCGCSRHPRTNRSCAAGGQWRSDTPPRLAQEYPSALTTGRPRHSRSLRSPRGSGAAVPHADVLPGNTEWVPCTGALGQQRTVIPEKMDQSLDSVAYGIGGALAADPNWADRPPRRSVDGQRPLTSRFG
jgi:hypothetical protein